MAKFKQFYREEFGTNTSRVVQALSYPIGIVVMLGGGLFVMIGNREKGFDMIAKAI